MKRIVNLSLTLLVAVMLNSCTFAWLVGYDVALTDVQPNVGGKITTTTIDNVTNNIYEDNNILLAVTVQGSRFAIDLTNKTKGTIVVDYDAITFVDCNNKACRTIHAGVKYDDKNNAQGYINIPPSARISDVIIPTDNVAYSQQWQELPILPNSFHMLSDRANAINNNVYKGKTMQLYIPIKGEAITPYLFTFSVRDMYAIN